MSRIMRIFGRGLIVLSLLVSLAVAILWWRERIGIRERWRAAKRGGGLVEVFCDAGRVVLCAQWPWRDEGFGLRRRPNDPFARWAPDGPLVYWMTQWERRALGVRLGSARGEPLRAFPYPGEVLTMDRQAPPAPAPVRSVYVAMPCWLMILLTCLPALAWGAAAWPRRWRTRRRRRLGLCLSCGYDLRGSPERCPECGMIAPPMSTVGECSKPASGR